MYRPFDLLVDFPIMQIVVVRFFNFAQDNDRFQAVADAGFSRLSGPRGLNMYIRSGNKVRLFNRATIIANPVRRPK